VHVLSNAYRVTQLYGPGPVEVNGAPAGKPFPAAFEETVENLVKNALVGSPAFNGVDLLPSVERTLPSVTPFRVCAPEGASRKGKAHYAFVERKGVKIKVKVSKPSHCATINASLSSKKYKARQPRVRTCSMPWPWLNTKLAEALHVTALSDEVESITVNATGGTFTITYGGETTAPINYNATALEVQEALAALPVVKPGNIKVTGGPGGEGGATPYVLTFEGALAEKAITPVTTNTSALTGGAKLATVIVLTPGGALDLQRFILSLIEQKAKVALEKAGFVEAIKRIEEKVALTPFTSCLDPLSAPAVNPATHRATNNEQPFPFYGEIQVE